MVFVPTDPPRIAHEYYRAQRRGYANVPEISEFGAMVATRTGQNAGQDGESIGRELAAALNPVLAKKPKKRQKKSDLKAKTKAERRDLVAARLRAGLVQYMLKLGYAMNDAVREAERALAQIRRDGSQDLTKRALMDEAASRMVFLSKSPGTAALGQTSPQNTKVQSYQGKGATPKALVRIET